MGRKAASLVYPHTIAFTGEIPFSVPDGPSAVTQDSFDLEGNQDQSLYLKVIKNTVISSTYGAHDLAGRPILGSVLSRGKRGKNKIAYPRGELRPIDNTSGRQITFLESAFFVNYLQFAHFGHLLTETCSAIYPLLLWNRSDSPARKLPILINDAISSKPDQLKCLIKLLDLDESQVIVVNRVTPLIRVGTLVMAAPTFIDRGFVSRHHVSNVKHLMELMLGHPIKSKNAKQPQKNIYVSRANLSNDRRLFLDEAHLEQLLVQRGWEVFHPQEHSLVDQINKYQQAQHICAAEGSALHLLFAVDPAPNQRVTLLCRESDNNFSRQFEAQSIEYRALEVLRHDDNCCKAVPHRNVVLRENTSLERLADLIDQTDPYTESHAPAHD